MVKKEKNKRILMFKLTTAVVAMFGFGFLLVPLYDIFCDVVGIGASPDRVSENHYKMPQVDESRLLEVSYLTNVFEGLGIDFKGPTHKSEIHPGELHTEYFSIKNNESFAVHVQAIPQVFPVEASQYFKKVHCFCFEQQTLAANEHKEIDVRYFVHPDLPEKYSNLTLSYLYLRVDPSQQDSGHNASLPHNDGMHNHGHDASMNMDTSSKHMHDESKQSANNHSMHHSGRNESMGMDKSSKHMHGESKQPTHNHDMHHQGHGGMH